MRLTTKKEIHDVVSLTKAHKDTFAIKELVSILLTEVETAAQRDETPEEVVLQFMEASTAALMDSPIYSDALVRTLYVNVLEAAAATGIQREGLLEDLLFQSLRRPVEIEGAKRKRHKDVRDRIVAAALDEFSDRGFHHATIDSIAERAGIAKGTVYRYFKTKEELFNALKEVTVREFVAFVKQEIEKQEDILKVIETVIKNYLGFFETNSAFFKVLLQEQKDFGREFSETFINELILALPGLKRRCWRASRDGYLKQMNYFTVFYGIIGFLNGVIHKWLHHGGEASLTAEIDTIKEVLFYGFAVSPEKVGQAPNLKVIS